MTGVVLARRGAVTKLPVAIAIGASSPVAGAASPMATALYRQELVSPTVMPPSGVTPTALRRPTPTDVPRSLGVGVPAIVTLAATATIRPPITPTGVPPVATSLPTATVPLPATLTPRPATLPADSRPTMTALPPSPTATHRAVVGASDPPSGQLLYSSNKEGAWALYRLRIETNDERRLTPLSADNYNGSWSPDGQQIAFVSERDGNPEIYVMGEEGGGVRRITADLGEDIYPVWAPDGRSLLFISNRNGAGNAAFAVYQVILADGRLVRLVNAPASWPAWSRDGTVVFTRSTNGNQAIYATTLEAQGVWLIDRAAGMDDDIPAFSSDGTRLAFCSGPSKENRQIVVARADGADRRAITNVAADNCNPAWSPDGQWLVFASDRNGTLQIYVMRADGSELRPITSGMGRKWYLSWHR